MSSGKIYLSIFLILIPLLNIHTKFNSEKYAVKNIPPGLIKDAGAVIREKSKIIEIENKSKAIERITQAVTIFRKSEQNYGYIEIPYDKFVEIIELEGKIFDKNGEEVRELESSEINDYSNYSNYSLFEDDRVKTAEMYYDKYPYTIEYVYELQFDGIVNLPSWYSRDTRDPVEFSSLKITVPSTYTLRYWCSNDSVHPQIHENGSYIDYLWQARNIPALTEEEQNENLEDLAILVKIAPSDFDMNGYEGSMTSWKDFGHWYNTLIEGRNILTENTVSEIKGKVNLLTDTRAKVETLYKYMQSKTHYVSVQLGIGGWQPFEASYVDKNGYGDCKALSNYMVSILKAAGITSYPVLMNSGNVSPFITGFASDQFNHVIVCVPLEKDTIWLECTSQDQLPGNIGWENENRPALIITPEGGNLVYTPVSESFKNLQNRNVSVNLYPNGLADINLKTKWFGDQRDYVMSVADDLSPRVQEKWLKEYFNVPDITLNKYSLNKNNDSSNTIELTASISLNKYGAISGKRIFFNPNIMERRTSVPMKMSKKISPLKFDYPFIDVDTIKYVLPAGFTIEAVPGDVEITTAFGKFVSKIIKNEDATLSFIRLLEIDNYMISPEKYSEYRDFMEKVVKADREHVVLVK